MTVPVDPKEKESVVIVCLVTDKKYRKMGGDEGLKLAIKRRTSGTDKTVLIGQVLVEDLLAGGLSERLGLIIKRDFSASGDARVILIHKYSDYYKSPGIGGDQVRRVRDWLAEECPFRVLDGPEKIDVLSSRVQTGLLVRNMCEVQGFEARGLQWPKFQLKWTAETGELDYPVIVKPIDACATDEAHWMTLHNDRTNPLVLPDGYLVQQFYEHFGILYKVYVIGEMVEIVARPSISARDCGPMLRFNTHKFKAAEGELSAAKMAEAMKRIEKVRGLVEEFARKLKEKLQLTWFGVDVIIPEDGGSGLRAAVIDINYMPGYDGIKDLSDKLIKAILD